MSIEKVSCDRFQTHNRVGSAFISFFAGGFGYLMFSTTLGTHQYGWMAFSVLILVVAAHFFLETFTHREYFLDLENSVLTINTSRLGHTSRRSFPFSTLRRVVLKTISESEDPRYTLSVIGERKHCIGAWTNVDEARARGAKIAEGAGVSLEDPHNCSNFDFRARI